MHQAVRLGMAAQHMPELAALTARALRDAPEPVAAGVSAFRRRLTSMHYMV